jgi:hypothetical protein
MITAAVLADEFVLDGLRDRIRPDALTVDEYGQTTQGAHGPLFGLDSVASLAACLHLLAENDGREITLNEHGSPGRGLPFLPPTSLTDLRRNGLITTRREGTSWRVG